MMTQFGRNRIDLILTKSIICFGRNTLGYAVFQTGVGVAASQYYYDSKHYVKTGQDPWSKDNFKRGKIIGKALGNNLGETFPDVDKMDWENKIVTSIKSLDTRAKSYQSASGVFNQLSCYLSELD